MKRTLKGFLSEMCNPPVPPLRKRIIWFAVWIPVIFVGLYCLDFPMWLNILITVLMLILGIAFFGFEIVSLKKDAELNTQIKNGDYFNNEKWRERYEKYRRKHDFKTVSASSMKSDLNRKFFRKSGIFMLITAALFFVPAIIIRTGAIETNIFLAIGGIIFLWWGLAKLLKTPVKNFIISCGDNLSHIERSYLNGKMLTFKRNGEYSVNSGINISGNYIVFYNSKNIYAIDRKDIISVKRDFHKTKFYGDGLYMGALMDYFVSFEVKKGEKIWEYSVQLGEFQTEMVYEALSVYHTSAQFSQSTVHDVG